MPVMASSNGNVFSNAFMSFWHTMTSTDRHASHDAPYRTGQHVPLAQSRHAPLTSIATSAIESRADLTSPYGENGPESSNGFIDGRMSPGPNSPYSPGMRSAMKRQSTDTIGNGEIQMQNFSEGLPPPPPVSHSWKRIDRWVEDHYTELWDNLCEGCSQNDVNELEHELDMTLPLEVRESLLIHDGQERGGLPTGVIFGLMLLDCEEIVHEWQNWRVVNEEFLNRRPSIPINPPIKAFAGAGPSSSSAPTAPSRDMSSSPRGLNDVVARQASQPPNAVQKAYAHPAWIPMARDWGGNYIAVDLAPGPMGKWGQVIIYGRDYDTKYVIARSWASFLATVADDISSGDRDKGGKVWIYEDEEGKQELKLKEFRQPDVNPPYLDILRWRCDQKYGRRASRRKSGAPNGLSVNPNLGPRSPVNGSPYGSPISAHPISAVIDDRGRSPNRFSAPNRANTASPRSMVGSPLARVSENAEAPQALKPNPVDKLERLVSIDTPRPSEDLGSARLIPRTSLESSDKENKSLDDKGKGKTATANSEMKTVEI